MIPFYEDGRVIPTKSFELRSTNETALHYDMDITFRITEACDLKCKYCMYWHHGKHYSRENILGSIDKLFEFFVASEMTSVLFYYHGGEPTKHPNILEILQYIKDKSKETGVQSYTELNTNFTLDTSKLETLLPYIDRLNISFHYNELIEREYKLANFYKNYELIVDKGLLIHNLDIMLDTVRADRLSDFYERIEEFITYKNIMHTEMIYGFWHYGEESNRKSKEQHLEFHDLHNKDDQQFVIDNISYNTSELFIEGVNCQGWQCDAGRTFMYVNGDGSVFSCGGHMTRFIRPEVAEESNTNLMTDENAVKKLLILRRIGTKCRWKYCGGDYPRDRVPPK